MRRKCCSPARVGIRRMRQCVPMDAELQAPHAAIVLRRCRTAKGRPGERRRLAASDEIYDRELQCLESGSSRPALVCRSAHARAAAKVTKIATTTMVISNASVGIMLPLGLFEGHYLRPMPGVIDRDQKSESAVESLSGRGQGLDARRVDQADTAVNDGDRSVAFKLGEGATDGLDGQAEIIGDVLAAHRKWNRVGRPLERE